MGKPQGCTSHGFHEFTWAPTPHEHGWGPWELRPTLGDNVEASYCACGASKARTREPDCVYDNGCGRDCTVECKAVLDALKRVSGTTKPLTSRPPYAVAYAVQGGALYEVALPGDATATAEGGRLVITHASMPVTGIVRITPMRTEGGS